MGSVHLRSLAIAWAILSGLALPASADPPDRVARISYLRGSVSFRSALVDEWSAATRNYPLTVGDHLWTERGGRAELELGSTFVRLAPFTEFSLLNLDDRLSQLRVTQGTATFRVQNRSDEAVEIDTPDGALTILEPGFYRVDVDDSGSRTTVTARSGRAEVTTGSRTFTIDARESLVLEAAKLPYTLRAVLGTDDFEDWALARDRRVQTSAAARYVSPQMIGYEDLDDYGAWQDAPDFGAVWFPRVRADWVPYRDGHWTWIGPWGWTWIDDEPWGFAPFHYGRWARISGGWGWVPGYRVVRPVYAPALVAFVGGAGWQADFRFGSEPVCWFPLGPREPFVPAYRVSAGYLRSVNAPHIEVRSGEVRNIRYANRDVPGAVTAVPRDAFMRARPVNASAIAVPREALRSASVVHAEPGPPPQATFAHRGIPAAAAPPSAAVDRPVIVRHAPADEAHAHYRNGPNSIAPPVQGPRPGQLSQPLQLGLPQRPERTPDRQLRDRPVQPAPQPQERFGQPGHQRQDWVVPPTAQPRERFATQARPRQQQVVPSAPQAVPPAPQPRERVAPQERPREDRAAPTPVQQRQERGAPPQARQHDDPSRGGKRNPEK